MSKSPSKQNLELRFWGIRHHAHKQHQMKQVVCDVPALAGLCQELGWGAPWWSFIPFLIWPRSRLSTVPREQKFWT